MQLDKIRTLRYWGNAEKIEDIREIVNELFDHDGNDAHTYERLLRIDSICDVPLEEGF